jgi:uncharacterized protein (TIGR02246 family)
MKSIISLIITVFFLTGSYAQTSKANQQLEALILEMETSWNSQDYSGKQFDTEAILVNRVGMYWRNKTEIVNAWNALSEIMFKHIKVKYAVKKIRFFNDKIALVVVLSTDTVVSDFHLPDGRKGGTKGETSESVHTYTIVNSSNEWKVTSLHITGIDKAAVPTPPGR